MLLSNFEHFGLFTLEQQVYDSEQWETQCPTE